LKKQIEDFKKGNQKVSNDSKLIDTVSKLIDEERQRSIENEKKLRQDFQKVLL